MKSEKEILSDLRRGLEFLKALAVFDQEPIQYQPIRENAQSALSLLENLTSPLEICNLHWLLVWIVRYTNHLDLLLPRNQEIKAVAQALYQNFEILEHLHEV